MSGQVESARLERDAQTDHVRRMTSFFCKAYTEARAKSAPWPWSAVFRLAESAGIADDALKALVISLDWLEELGRRQGPDYAAKDRRAEAVLGSILKPPERLSASEDDVCSFLAHMGLSVDAEVEAVDERVGYLASVAPAAKTWLREGSGHVASFRRWQAHSIGRVSTLATIQQKLDLSPDAPVDEITQAAEAMIASLESRAMPHSLQASARLAAAAFNGVYRPWQENLREAEEARKRDLQEAQRRERSEKAALRSRLEKTASHVDYILGNTKKPAHVANPFFMLGIPPKAVTVDLLKKVKKELVLLTHPDKIPATPEYEDLKARATTAFQTAIAAVEKCLVMLDKEGLQRVKLKYGGLRMENPPYAHLWSYNVSDDDSVSVEPKVRVRKERKEDTKSHPRTNTENERPIPRRRGAKGNRL